MTENSYSLDLLIEDSRREGMTRLLEKIQVAMIEKAIVLANGNCAAAADLLGVKRTTLAAKRIKFGMKMGPPGRRSA